MTMNTDRAKKATHLIQFPEILVLNNVSLIRN